MGNTRLTLTRSFPNTRVTHSTMNHDRSESSVAIDPLNSQRMVGASKRFSDPANYKFSVTAYGTTDGGETWTDSELSLLPGCGGLSDPVVAYGPTGRAYLIAMSDDLNIEPGGICCYTTDDSGAHWSVPIVVHDMVGNADDKECVAVDTTGGPYSGRVYVLWDTRFGDETHDMAFARSWDSGAHWHGEGPMGSPSPPGSVVMAGEDLVNDSFWPVAVVAPDSSLHVLWRANIGGSDIKWIVSTDGGDTFSGPEAIATGLEPVSDAIGPAFRIYEFPAACIAGNQLVVAWHHLDAATGRVRIFHRRLDLGTGTWLGTDEGTQLLAGPVATDAALSEVFPQLAGSAGRLTCSFYEFGSKGSGELIDVVVAVQAGAAWERITVTDQPWDPTVSAPTPKKNVRFIGDYFGLAAHNDLIVPLWTDTRTGMQEMFTSRVHATVQRLYLIVDRSEYAVDEVNSMSSAHGGAASFPEALYLVVEGFTLDELGMTSDMSPSQRAGVAPVPTFKAKDMSAIPERCDSLDPDLPADVRQRFVFTYTVQFTGIAGFPPGEGNDTKPVTVTAAAWDLTDESKVLLTKASSPFMLDGKVPWLSRDLRVFQVREGVDDPIFGLTPNAGALDYLDQVLKKLRDSGGHELFESSMPTDQEASTLELRTRVDGHDVYNFAIAQVRYVGGTIAAEDVGVAFRLFRTNTSSTDYDSHTYPLSDTTPAVALLGIRGGEVATIPCYGTKRVSATTKLSLQTDATNVRTIDAGGGDERYEYFGCWLDFNQDDERFPLYTDDFDGPWTDRRSIKQLMRWVHGCLVAQVIYGKTPKEGTPPASTDKLSQRNLAYSPSDNPGRVGTRTVAHTFELQRRGGDQERITSAKTLAFGPTDKRNDGKKKGTKKPDFRTPSQEPGIDDLIIRWGLLPRDASIDLYLPAVDADAVIDVTRESGLPPRLRRLDPHTVRCEGPDVTFVPLPGPPGEVLAGLLTVHLPPGVRYGQHYEVVVQHVAGWPRRVVGSFQLSIPIRHREDIAAEQAGTLSVLRYIAEGIKPEDRWYPVFVRYLGVLARRLRGWGIDPDEIKSTPDGSGASWVGDL